MFSAEDDHLLRFAKRDHLLRFARAPTSFLGAKRGDDHLLRFARAGDDHLLRFAKAGDEKNDTTPTSDIFSLLGW